MSSDIEVEETKKRMCKDCGYRYSRSYSPICPNCIVKKEERHG